MTPSTDHLRELAEAATPGPWLRPTFGGAQVLTGDSWNTVCVMREGRGRDHRMAAWETGRGAADPEANAAFIAAANPQTILSLLDAIDKLTAERDEAHKELYQLRIDRDNLRDALDATLAGDQSDIPL